MKMKSEGGVCDGDGDGDGYFLSMIVTMMVKVRTSTMMMEKLTSVLHFAEHTVVN